MSAPPPPPPDQEPQLPQMIEVPLQAIKTIAKLYNQNRGMVKVMARMAGQKIPPELDTFMREMNEDGANPQTIERLNQMANNPQRPYGPEQEEWAPGHEIVEPRIGERVLTRDLAYRAWLMNKKQGISLREIAMHFTNEGYPCSHATVAEYVNQVDEEMDENTSLRRSAILKGALLIIVPAVGAFVLEHFLKW